MSMVESVLERLPQGPIVRKVRETVRRIRERVRKFRESVTGGEAVLLRR